MATGNIRISELDMLAASRITGNEKIPISKQVENTTYYSTYAMDAGSFSTYVGNFVIQQTDLNNRLSNVETKVNTANTNATNALNTANAASTKADAADGKADQAISAAQTITNIINDTFHGDPDAFAEAMEAAAQMGDEVDEAKGMASNAQSAAESAQSAASAAAQAAANANANANSRLKGSSSSQTQEGGTINNISVPSISEGEQKIMVFKNTSSSSTLIITPPSSGVTTPTGQAISDITVQPGGYAELNFMNIGGTIYLRAL